MKLQMLHLYQSCNHPIGRCFLQTHFPQVHLPASRHDLVIAYYSEILFIYNLAPDGSLALTKADRYKSSYSITEIEILKKKYKYSEVSWEILLTHWNRDIRKEARNQLTLERLEES